MSAALLVLIIAALAVLPYVVRRLANKRRGEFRLWFHVLISRQRSTLRTTGGRGTVACVRWEWGLGKGQWKRALRAVDDSIRVRVLYLGICSRYSLHYEGRHPRFVYEAL